MLQSPKSGKKGKEKRHVKYNIFNIRQLQTSLITRVFATNFDIG